MNPNDIIEMAESRYSLVPGTIKSEARYTRACQARLAALYLSFKFIDCSYAELSRFFRRTEQTVKYLLQKVNINDTIIDSMWKELSDDN
jgi:chromosomal replication initiation ATPase DnaA